MCFKPSYIAAGLLSLHGLLLAYSAARHSPTLNEPGHLVAGISVWRFGRFDVYNVNPPLVRVIAALPIVIVGAETDWRPFHEGPGARSEFPLGEAFIAANSERAMWLMTLARWACVPFGLLGGWVCWRWGKEVACPLTPDPSPTMGRGGIAGLIALTLWCFCPNTLGHGALITPDLGATALAVAACYTFWRWLKSPTWWSTLGSGLVLGLAELAKTTLVVFYPLWFVMWAVYRCGEGIERRRKNSPQRHGGHREDGGTVRKDEGGRMKDEAEGAGEPGGAQGRKVSRDSSSLGFILRSKMTTWWAREFAMLCVRTLVAVYVINLGYGFEGSLTQLREFKFVSAALGAEDGAEKAPAGGGNRFQESWLGALPVPLPKHYLLGIDLQKRDFENYGRPSYLRGEFRERGWWYYYLYALAIKVPLGTWVLVLLAALAGFLHWLQLAFRG